MRSAIELRNDAKDCLRLAERTKKKQHKSLFLMMAQAWIMLADQAEHIEAAPKGELKEPASLRTN